ncbi:MAG: site-2 protease family protein [Candidatus Peribacteraceae bacterium]|nr:site-2 protease family protein [Candidatus Peribacteraceae bacterium]
MSSFLNPSFIIAILISLSVHEWAHGWVASKLGDPTAHNAGRLTLNPIAHLDPMGALMFLFVGFGWAKPVPVNPYYFRHPKRDMALVALAGPASNFLLGTLCFFGLLLLLHDRIASPFALLTAGENGTVTSRVLVQILGSGVFINFALMAFNLLPIAPLDGSKVLHLFIPPRHEDRYELFMQRGPMILIFLILLGAFTSVSPLSAWVFGVMEFVLGMLGGIAALFF